MRRLIMLVIKNTWFGLGYTVLAVIGALIYTWLAGPLFGQLNAEALAFTILVIGVMGVAGIVSFFRSPNPYSRLYYRYELMDLPERHDELDSGGSGWLWQVAPMGLVAVVLLPFFV